MAKEPRRYYLIQNPGTVLLDAYGSKNLGNGSFLFNLLASADQTDFDGEQEITFAFTEESETFEPEAVLGALLRLSRVVVPILGGQDINTAGASLNFGAPVELLPAVNNDFTVVPGTPLIVLNRTGFIRLSLNLVGASQTSARRQPAAALLLNGGPLLDGVMTDYSRDLTNDLVQLEAADLVKPVVEGDIISVFTIATGTAGASLSVANQSYVRIEYVNNAQA